VNGAFSLHFPSSDAGSCNENQQEAFGLPDQPF
jgi:hypothetical protein